MEDDGLNLVVSEPARLIYVLGPKCGSTGVVNLFLGLSGFDPAPGTERAFARKGMKDGSLLAAGMHFYRCGLAQVRVMRSRFPDYALFTNIRDPYGRALSNYYSKINRYARAFDPAVFRYGKWKQFLSGPRKWGQSRHGNPFMRERISFEQMLEGVLKHGADFDPHFDLQHRILGLQSLPYDRVLRLETLDRDLLPALKDHGMPDEMMARAQTLVHGNASDYTADKQSYFSPRARDLIEQIYADDFSALGYPRHDRTAPSP